MVGVAQLVEHRVVVARVAGSSPVTHPGNIAPGFRVGGNVFRIFPGQPAIRQWCISVIDCHDCSLEPRQVGIPQLSFVKEGTRESLFLG